MRAGIYTLREHREPSAWNCMKDSNGQAAGIHGADGRPCPSERAVHALWMSWQQGSRKERRPPVQEYACLSLPGVSFPKQAQRRETVL